MSNHIDDAIPIEGWPRHKPVLSRYPSPGPVPVRITRQTPPFVVVSQLNGDLCVVDADFVSVAIFNPAYREFAEEMRDRLNIRHLAQQGEGS